MKNAIIGFFLGCMTITGLGVWLNKKNQDAAIAAFNNINLNVVNENDMLIPDSLAGFDT